MSSLVAPLGNFSEEYNKLDPETQAKLDNLIAGIEEVGQDIVGGTIFQGSSELLRSIMPCLHTLSSTITSSVIDLDNGMQNHKLSWEPNDFIIPQNVLVRANERYAKSMGISLDSKNQKETDEEYEIDDCGLLARTNSSGNAYHFEDDNVSSM